jgi:hypothetical protein
MILVGIHIIIKSKKRIVPCVTGHSRRVPALERVSDAAVRPVEIDIIVVLYCDVSYMQVAMNQRLRYCAIHQLVAHAFQSWTIGA